MKISDIFGWRQLSAVRKLTRGFSMQATRWLSQLKTTCWWWVIPFNLESWTGLRDFSRPGCLKRCVRANLVTLFHCVCLEHAIRCHCHRYRDTGHHNLRQTDMFFSSKLKIGVRWTMDTHQSCKTYAVSVGPSSHNYHHHFTACAPTLPNYPMPTAPRSVLKLAFSHCQNHLLKLKGSLPILKKCLLKPM